MGALLRSWLSVDVTNRRCARRPWFPEATISPPPSLPGGRWGPSSCEQRAASWRTEAHQTTKVITQGGEVTTGLSVFRADMAITRRPHHQCRPRMLRLLGEQPRPDPRVERALEDRVAPDPSESCTSTERRTSRPVSKGTQRSVGTGRPGRVAAARRGITPATTAT